MAPRAACTNIFYLTSFTLDSAVCENLSEIAFHQRALVDQLFGPDKTLVDAPQLTMRQVPTHACTQILNHHGRGQVLDWVEPCVEDCFKKKTNKPLLSWGCDKLCEKRMCRGSEEVETPSTSSRRQAVARLRAPLHRPTPSCQQHHQSVRFGIKKKKKRAWWL